MALIITKVDLDTVRLVGRWRSDTVLCYLHMTDKIFMGGLAVNMFNHRYYTLIPSMHASN